MPSHEKGDRSKTIDERARKRLDLEQAFEQQIQSDLVTIYFVDRSLPLFVPDQSSAYGREIARRQKAILQNLDDETIRDILEATRENKAIERRGITTWQEMENGVRMLLEEGRRRKKIVGAPPGPPPSPERTARRALEIACKSIFNGNSLAALFLINFYLQRKDLEEAIRLLREKPERISSLKRAVAKLDRSDPVWEKAFGEIEGALRSYVSIIDMRSE